MDCDVTFKDIHMDGDVTFRVYICVWVTCTLMSICLTALISSSFVCRKQKYEDK